MGPNLYVSGGGGFTHMHQDGHGTVDSGHTVVSGYNEVIMIRRMPESHKNKVVKIVSSQTQTNGKSVGDYDPLYKLPHGDVGNGSQGLRPDWFSSETVESLRKEK
jgi:hypothetical protein